jgi:hypothetical protein
MTTETLQAANQLQHRIEDLDNMIQLTEDFLHDAKYLYISDHLHGEVEVSPEARLDIINIVLGDLREQQDNLKEEFNKL